MAKQPEVGHPIYCPLQTATSGIGIECDFEQCAWWLVSSKKCAILVVAEDIHQALQMGNLLKALADPAKLRELAQRLAKMRQGGEKAGQT